jgi:hypothetical protein
MSLELPILRVEVLTILTQQFIMEIISDLVIPTNWMHRGGPTTKTVSLMVALLLRDQSPLMLPHPLPLVTCGVRSSILDTLPVPSPIPTLAIPSFS